MQERRNGIVAAIAADLFDKLKAGSDAATPASGHAFRTVERNESRCARAFIGYVRKLPHRFTCLVRRNSFGGTNQMAFSCDHCSNLVK